MTKKKVKAEAAVSASTMDLGQVLERLIESGNSFWFGYDADTKEANERFKARVGDSKAESSDPVTALLMAASGSVQAGRKSKAEALEMMQTLSTKLERLEQLLPRLHDNCPKAKGKKCALCDEHHDDPVAPEDVGKAALSAVLMGLMSGRTQVDVVGVKKPAPKKPEGGEEN